MKDKKPLDWIPLYIDKHLFGSTRLELEPDERSVWIDLLVLAGKNTGHVRANEGMPYQIKQLAGMLVISEELLERTIKKCIKYKKIEILKDGTIYLPSWQSYKLSPRHKRRFESMSDEEDTMTEKEDTISQSADTILKDKVIDKVIDKDIYPQKFEDFYKPYPRKIEKKDAFTAWKQLTNKQKDEVVIASKNYAIEMKRERRKLDKIKHPASFLNKDKERWKDYLEVTKPYQVGEDDPERKETDKQKIFFEKRLALKESLYKKYKPGFDKAMKDGDQDKVEEIENKIKTQLADFSQLYFKTRED